jgi:two-component system response regulator BaeR
MRLRAIGYVADPNLVSKLECSLTLHWPASRITVVNDVCGLVNAGDPVDVAFIDEALTGNRTCEIVSALRTLAPSPLFVVLSDYCEEKAAEILQAGADICFSPDDSPRLIAARIAAVLRLAPPRVVARAGFRYGPLAIYGSTREAAIDGSPLKLTRLEFDLLQALSVAEGSLVTNSQLQMDFWGTGDGLYMGSLRKYVQRLRRQLDAASPGSFQLLSKHGLGYRLVLNSVLDDFGETAISAGS